MSAIEPTETYAEISHEISESFGTPAITGDIISLMDDYDPNQTTLIHYMINEDHGFELRTTNPTEPDQVVTQVIEMTKDILVKFLKDEHEWMVDYCEKTNQPLHDGYDWLINGVFSIGLLLKTGLDLHIENLSIDDAKTATLT